MIVAIVLARRRWNCFKLLLPLRTVQITWFFLIEEVSKQSHCSKNVKSFKLSR